MAGIGAWIAAMENWRTAVLEKPMRATKDLKILGWMLHWIASSWAILRACCKEVKGKSITVEMSTRFEKPLSLRGRVGHSLAPATEVTLTS